MFWKEIKRKVAVLLSFALVTATLYNGWGGTSIIARADNEGTVSGGDAVVEDVHVHDDEILIDDDVVIDDESDVVIDDEQDAVVDDEQVMDSDDAVVDDDSDIQEDAKQDTAEDEQQDDGAIEDTQSEDEFNGTVSGGDAVAEEPTIPEFEYVYVDDNHHVKHCTNDDTIEDVLEDCEYLNLLCIWCGHEAEYPWYVDWRDTTAARYLYDGFDNKEIIGQFFLGEEFDEILSMYKDGIITDMDGFFRFSVLDGLAYDDVLELWQAGLTIDEAVSLAIANSAMLYAEYNDIKVSEVKAITDPVNIPAIGRSNKPIYQIVVNGKYALCMDGHLSMPTGTKLFWQSEGTAGWQNKIIGYAQLGLEQQIAARIFTWCAGNESTFITAYAQYLLSLDGLSYEDIGKGNYDIVKYNGYRDIAQVKLNEILLQPGSEVHIYWNGNNSFQRLLVMGDGSLTEEQEPSTTKYISDLFPGPSGGNWYQAGVNKTAFNPDTYRSRDLATFALFDDPLRTGWHYSSGGTAGGGGYYSGHYIYYVKMPNSTWELGMRVYDGGELIDTVRYDDNPEYASEYGIAKLFEERTYDAGNVSWFWDTYFLVNPAYLLKYQGQIAIENLSYEFYAFDTQNSDEEGEPYTYDTAPVVHLSGIFTADRYVEDWQASISSGIVERDNSNAWAISQPVSNSGILSYKTIEPVLSDSVGDIYNVGLYDSPYVEDKPIEGYFNITVNGSRVDEIKRAKTTVDGEYVWDYFMAASAVGGDGYFDFIDTIVAGIAVDKEPGNWHGRGYSRRESKFYPCYLFKFYDKFAAGNDIGLTATFMLPDGIEICTSPIWDINFWYPHMDEDVGYCDGDTYEWAVSDLIRSRNVSALTIDFYHYFGQSGKLWRQHAGSNSPSTQNYSYTSDGMRSDVTALYSEQDGDKNQDVYVYDTVAKGTSLGMITTNRVRYYDFNFFALRGDRIFDSGLGKSWSYNFENFDIDGILERMDSGDPMIVEYTYYYNLNQPIGHNYNGEFIEHTVVPVTTYTPIRVNNDVGELGGKAFSNSTLTLNWSNHWTSDFAAMSRDEKFASDYGFTIELPESGMAHQFYAKGIYYLQNGEKKYLIPNDMGSSFTSTDRVSNERENSWVYQQGGEVKFYLNGLYSEWYGYIPQDNTYSEGLAFLNTLYGINHFYLEIMVTDYVDEGGYNVLNPQYSITIPIDVSCTHDSTFTDDGTSAFTIVSMEKQSDDFCDMQMIGNILTTVPDPTKKGTAMNITISVPVEGDYTFRFGCSGTTNQGAGNTFGVKIDGIDVQRPDTNSSLYLDREVTTHLTAGTHKMFVYAYYVVYNKGVSEMPDYAFGPGKFWLYCSQDVYMETCTDGGYFGEVCTECYQTMSTEGKDALGHNYQLRGSDVWYEYLYGDVELRSNDPSYDTSVSLVADDEDFVINVGYAYFVLGFKFHADAATTYKVSLSAEDASNQYYEFSDGYIQVYVDGVQGYYSTIQSAIRDGINLNIPEGESLVYFHIQNSYSYRGMDGSWYYGTENLMTIHMDNGSIPADCFNGTQNRYVCSRCGDKQFDYLDDALGHDYAEEVNKIMVGDAYIQSGYEDRMSMSEIGFGRYQITGNSSYNSVGYFYVEFSVDERMEVFLDVTMDRNVFGGLAGLSGGRLYFMINNVYKAQPEIQKTKTGGTYSVSLGVLDAGSYTMQIGYSSFEYLRDGGFTVDFHAGHTFVDCETPGKYNYECKRCGADNLQDVDALGHDFHEPDYKISTESSTETTNTYITLQYNDEYGYWEAVPTYNWASGYTYNAIQTATLDIYADYGDNEYFSFDYRNPVSNSYTWSSVGYLYVYNLSNNNSTYFRPYYGPGSTDEKFNTQSISTGAGIYRLQIPVYVAWDFENQRYYGTIIDFHDSYAEATCTVGGGEIWECIRCGKSEPHGTEPLGHDMFSGYEARNKIEGDKTFVQNGMRLESNITMDEYMQTAVLEFDLTLDSDLKVQWGVGSETRYDLFNVWVDSNNVVSNQSGIQTGEFTISAGTHHVKLQYANDGSTNQNGNMAWVELPLSGGKPATHYEPGYGMQYCRRGDVIEETDIPQLPNYDLTMYTKFSGNYADFSWQVTYTVHVLDELGQKPKYGFKIYDADGLDTGQVLNFDEDGNAMITMEHDQTLTLKDFFGGEPYSITYDDATGKAHTVVITGDFPSSAIGLEDEARINWEYIRSAIVPAGIEINLTPFNTMFFVMVAIIMSGFAIRIYSISRRRKRQYK